MNDYLIETIYEGDHYNIPYSIISEWYAFMKDLSVFQIDCGNLQIQFIDKFNKYKIKKTLICVKCNDWYGININHKCFKCLGGDFKQVIINPASPA